MENIELLSSRRKVIIILYFFIFKIRKNLYHNIFSSIFNQQLVFNKECVSEKSSVAVKMAALRTIFILHLFSWNKDSKDVVSLFRTCFRQTY